MKKYVQILNGKANPIVIEDDKVEELQNAGIKIIDVTDIIPQPQTGWLYNSETGIFSEPPIPEPITTISNIDLWDRFLEAEQVNLVNHTNSKAKKFLFELRLRSQLDLINSKLISAINALESAGIIGAGRAEEVLA